MKSYLVVGALMALAVAVSTSASAADAGAMGVKALSADELVPSVVAASVDLSIAEPVTLAQIALGGFGVAAASFSASVPIKAQYAYEATAPPRAAAVPTTIYSTDASGLLTAADRSSG